MTHTPEPWKVSRRFDIYKDHQRPDVGGSFIGSTRGNGPLPESVNLRCEADAERIVACVNACQGIDNPEIVPFAFDHIKVALSKLDWYRNLVESRIEKEPNLKLCHEIIESIEFWLNGFTKPPYITPVKPEEPS